MVYADTWYINDLAAEYVQVLGQTDSNGNITDLYTYGTNRLTHETPGFAEIYTYDGRGSVAETLRGGAVTQTLRYTPYGELQQGGEVFAPFYGYNGEEHSPETGLQYLRARYYAPALSSFTSEDTIGGDLLQPLTQNLYLYAGGSPVNYLDPSGHGWLSNIWNAVKNTAKKVVETVTSAAKKVVTTVASTAKKVVSKAGKAVSGIVNKYVAPVVGGVINKVRSVTSGLVSTVTNSVQSFISNFTNRSITTITGSINGFSANIGKGSIVLGSVLDMHLQTIDILNRRFCSSEQVRAKSARLRKASQTIERTNKKYTYEPGAVIINRTLETFPKFFEKLPSFLKVEHLAIIFGGSDGTWHYTSYEGEVFYFEKINPNALESLTAINQELQRLNIASERNYTRSAFVPGNFDAAKKQARIFSNDPNSIPYERGDVQQGVDDAFYMARPDLKETQYSLLFNNCGHVAMSLFFMGESTDGVSMEEKYRLAELNYFGKEQTDNFFPNHYLDVVKSQMAISNLPRKIFRAPILPPGLFQ